MPVMSTLLKCMALNLAGIEEVTAAVTLLFLKYHILAFKSVQQKNNLKQINVSNIDSLASALKKLT